ncbi:hypothetical protein, partial [Streptomyces tateyamensis]|uniref:hypothetical protein n=1 Tax=Streptomyces tateyamensis TaxID=565073 RepID=UPI001C64A2ED
EGLREIARHLLPVRRKRSNARVVKRKMSNFGVKRAKHRLWPQPTRNPAEAVSIAPHYRTAPINPPTKAPHGSEA